MISLSRNLTCRLFFAQTMWSFGWAGVWDQFNLQLTAYCLRILFKGGEGRGMLPGGFQTRNGAFGCSH